MDSAKVAQDAPKPPPAATEDKIPFARFAHELLMRKEPALSEALRASLNVRKSDVATAMFARSFLEAELKKLTGEES